VEPNALRIVRNCIQHLNKYVIRNELFVNYKLSEYLGQGGQALVYKVIKARSASNEKLQEYAVKVFNKNELSEG
jgi:hypothetical protein